MTFSLVTAYPNGVSSFGIPVIGGVPVSVFGNFWFVNTTSTFNGDGKSPASPFTTMAQALTAGGLGDNDVVFVRGKVREQLVAPVGVTGVKIVGMVGGNIRDDDGVKWYAPASPVAGQALIEILEQGWEFHNILFSPDTSSGACIKAHRNEDATYPDSSHFVVRNCRFVGTSLTTTYGIQDVGGNHHYIIEDCEFQTLTNAIYCSSTSIAVPLRNTIRNNKFMGNTNDITTSLSYSLIEGNRFFTAGSGATNKVISTTFNSSQGGLNLVTGNVFPNTEAQIAPGNGYTGAADDTWTGNLVNNQAAYAFGQPA